MLGYFSPNERNVILAVLRRGPQKGIPHRLRGVGFDGHEEVVVREGVREGNIYIFVEYAIGVRTLFFKSEMDIAEIVKYFQNKSWTIGPGMKIWRIFSQPAASPDRFDRLMEKLEQSLLIKKAYSIILDEFFVAGSKAEKPEIVKLLALLEEGGKTKNDQGVSELKKFLSEKKVTIADYNNKSEIEKVLFLVEMEYKKMKTEKAMEWKAKTTEGTIKIANLNAFIRALKKMGFSDV